MLRSPRCQSSYTIKCNLLPLRERVSPSLSPHHLQTGRDVCPGAWGHRHVSAYGRSAVGGLAASPHVSTLSVSRLPETQRNTPTTPAPNVAPLASGKGITMIPTGPNVFLLLTAPWKQRFEAPSLSHWVNMRKCAQLDFPL